MKTNKLKILIILPLALLISLFVFFRLYNKPHIDVDKATADLIIPSDSILDDYMDDETIANKRYVNKVVQISGTIADISFESGNSIITIQNPDQQSGIICHMLPEENMNVLNLKKDNQISIKGICTGYLMDVMMVRCVLVN